MAENVRRLYRSRKNRILGGVCGGLGEYLNADPVLIRILWILSVVMGGFGILLYLVALVIVPSNPELEYAPAETPRRVPWIIGGALMLIGVILLLDNLDVFSFHKVWHMGWEIAFPSGLILAGIYLILRKKNPVADTGDAASQGESAQQASTSATGSAAPEGGRRLTRSVKDRKLLGVCGGIGEYFSLDPSIIRIGFVLFTLLSGGAGILFYLVMALVFPEDTTRIA